jgi:prepilin-type N-terminal cleavage/methylation domain-containing protein
VRRGFTLVEVIVALAIAGAVVAGAYGVLLRVVASRDSVARERERVLPAVAARQALAAWLAGAAHVDGGGPFRGVDRRDGPLPADELAFAVGDGGAGCWQRSGAWAGAGRTRWRSRPGRPGCR